MHRNDLNDKTNGLIYLQNNARKLLTKDSMTNVIEHVESNEFDEFWGLTRLFSKYGNHSKIFSKIAIEDSNSNDSKILRLH